MKISVITVCLNAQDSIERTIKSVLEQSYPDVEFVIVDGVSRDRTLQVIRPYQDRIACFVSEPDKGIYDAMNKGIRLSSGELIYFLNAGDEFSDVSLLAEVAAFWKGEDILYGDVGIIGEKKEYIYNACSYSGKILNARALFNNMFCQQRAFFNRLLFNKVGMFNVSFKVIADFELIFKAYQRGYVFKYFPFEISRIPLGGYSNVNFDVYIWERVRILYSLKPLQWFWIVDQFIGAVKRGSFLKYVTSKISKKLK
jgi:glycosyltransferase involved in cell wall biosynthesis